MMYEFGWSPYDWDRLAAGIVAGHIIECGTQCTGGNFTDWPLVKSYRRIGFPLVEAEEDGSFVVTKHPNTGGLVSVHTVAEQILYEIGAAGLHDAGRRRAIRFGPARAGWARSRAGDRRARRAGAGEAEGVDQLSRRMARVRPPRRLGSRGACQGEQGGRGVLGSAGGRGSYDQALHQFIGWNACHAPLATCEPGEVLVQFAVRDQDERKINSRFAPQIVPRVLGTVPGITYIADQGRPRASEVVAFWPALVSREAVRAASSRSETRTLPSERTVRVPLVRLCLARSGDKGDTANIGVIARSEAIYAWMLEHLTPAFVKRHFDDVCEGEVERFELPNLLAVNFLLHRSLGGGGTLSLLLDAQGKTYAQYLLAAEVEVPEESDCMQQILESLINKNSPTFKANHERMRQLVAELRARVAEAREGGGAKYVQRHREQGKLPVRERIARLDRSGLAVSRAVAACRLRRVRRRHAGRRHRHRHRPRVRAATSSSSRTMRR